MEVGRAAARVGEPALAGDLQQQIEHRGLVQAGLALDVSEAATDVLARGGYSSEFGVRALRRHLEAYVLAPAARLIAAAGKDAHGGLLVVRCADEAHGPSSGARLGAEQLQQMHVELARLTGAWEVADAARTELRVAEELALGALAAGEDAEDLVHAVTAAGPSGPLISIVA